MSVPRNTAADIAAPADASPAQRLRALAATAVIGTDRAGASAGAATPAELLTLAAVCGARARAGRRPARVSASMTACPVDPVPTASVGATSVLARLLAEPDAGLLEEWCDLAARRGVRVADALAPLLLAWWCRQPRRPEVVWRALGTRGAWLASLNPDWRKPTAAEMPANAAEVWETGTLAERVALLTAVRRADAARGLALVEATWAGDGADARQRFIECLVEGCSIDDERFLESALDDRSKLVRRQAAGVLARIPGSGYRSRMNERGRAIIGVEARGVFKGRKTITLTPPSEFDKAWERDAIEEKAPTGVGPRAWWMRQILEATDVAIWEEATGLSPAQVLDALAADDYAKEARAAIHAAACRSRNAAWCRELLARTPRQKGITADDLRPLAAALPAAEAEAGLLEIAAHDSIAWAAKWLVLAATGRAWSAGYSERALTMLKAYQPKKVDTYWIYEGAERVSRLVAPSAADLFEEVVLAQCTHQPSDSVKKSLTRARLRAEMHKELA